MQLRFFHLICIIHDFMSFHHKAYTGHCQPWQLLGGIHANLPLQHYSLTKLLILSDQFPTLLEHLTEVLLPQRGQPRPCHGHAEGSPDPVWLMCFPAGTRLHCWREPGENRLVFRHLS